MKRFLTIIASFALLASCSFNNDWVEQNKGSQSGDSLAVSFGVYVNKSAATKAGLAGVLTTDRLKGEGGGFGVFAYYGNGALYNETSKPDFMYNQKVEYKTIGGTSVWTYEPIKYWPNEYGAAASSEAADRLTFFAYAPHIAVTPSTGLVTGDATSGIIGMSRNIATGDPVVMYEANLKPGSGVDLCWGVAADDFTSSVDGNNNHVEQGYPFLNVIKPKTGDRIALDFNHALAQLNVQIDADIDAESHGGEELANDGTRIYVRSVTFSGFALRGSLNLNSNKTKGPSWYDISGTGRVKRDPVTIYDGRTDGIEGMATAADPNEVPAGLNPAIIQSRPYDPAVLDGVKHEPVNLFASTTATDPIMVVPVTGVPLSVTIVYDIETADPKLLGYMSDGETRGVSVENTITKSLPDLILAAGKCYVLSLHLGLTSVKLDADVKTWVETDPSKADLPPNITGIGSIEFSVGGTPMSFVSAWKGQTSLAAPTVRVLDLDGNPLTDCTIGWQSNNTDVASVASDGTVTLNGASGTAYITATATRESTGGSASASYKVYVNEVTGISIAPATSDIVIGGTLDLTTTLEINGGNGIYGTIGNDLALIWSYDDEKVTLPTVGNPYKEGETIVAKANATTTSGATAGDVTEVTVWVETPFAASTLSDKSTLTCVDKISIASVDLGATSTTVWLPQGASIPTVTVMGTNGQALTSGVTTAWTASDNTSVATVTEAGVVTLHGVGSAKLTVTASLEGSTTTEACTKTADFMVYVNNVTGVTVAPSTANIVKDGSLDLTATLIVNGGSDVNGTIATWPTVSWSSNYDKVSVNTTSTASQSGSDIVATMTASAAADAVTNSEATITATVGTPYASTDVSDTSTLTCVDKISVASVELSATSTTLWLAAGTTTTPGVTVKGSDGSDITNVVTLSWTVAPTSSDVAEFTSQGNVTLKKSGVAVLRVTASLAGSATTEESSDFAEYLININEVTGISVDPSSATILPGGTVTLTASLTTTDHGAVTSLTMPEVSWTSGTTAYVTVSPNTGMSTVATGVVTGGSSEITATVDPAYVQSGATGSASVTVTCSNTTSGTGTGYTGGWN